MASAAAIDGIQANGLRWKASVRIKIPSDIPSLFEECDTNADVVRLGHSIATGVIDSFRVTTGFPAESRQWLEGFKSDLADTFVWDNIDSVEAWATDEDSDGLVDELIYRLNDLYDWADYHRILLSPVRHD